MKTLKLSYNYITISYDKPYTFYFKSDKELSNNYHVYIEIDEKISEPLIIQLNLIPSANKCLQYLFNNVNIKSLLKLDQTEKVQSRITSLSIEHGI